MAKVTTGAERRGSGSSVEEDVARVMALPYDQRFAHTRHWTEEHRRIARKIEMQRIRDDAEYDFANEPEEEKREVADASSLTPADIPSGFLPEEE